MLCCVVLFCFVLCCFVCVVLFCVVLCCVVLCCIGGGSYTVTYRDVPWRKSVKIECLDTLDANHAKASCQDTWVGDQSVPLGSQICYFCSLFVPLLVTPLLSFIHSPSKVSKGSGQFYGLDRSAAAAPTKSGHGFPLRVSIFGGLASTITMPILFSSSVKLLSPLGSFHP